MTDITVPSLGESVSEATVANWFKQVGEAVKADEPICELETDKVTLEVNAPASGVLESIAVEAGGTVETGAVLGKIKEGATAAASAASASAPAKKDTPTDAPAAGPEEQKPRDNAAASNKPAPQATPAQPASADLMREPPSVRRISEEKGLDLSSVPASGKDGRHTKGDVMNASAGGRAQQGEPSVGGSPQAHREGQQAGAGASANKTERVKMTKLRQAIARRLKESQNTAAILTTFNEIDMSAVMALRAENKDAFEKKFGVRLGFMGFFIKAAVQALKELPAVNAHIEGDEIVYKHYYDIGVAVSTDTGLVVPVVRDCDNRGIAGIESEILRLAKLARDGKLSMNDMSGGTFSITNGGVFGSLMATPIINPPQSGILGMHKIEDRPVVVDGQIVIRPMMYIALSYDHRIIDGRESVTFLKRVKEMVENPGRLLLEV